MEMSKKMQNSSWGVLDSRKVAVQALLKQVTFTVRKQKDELWALERVHPHFI